MIYKIFSSTLSSFKVLEFKPGLNVLVAEKSKNATSRQTRNAAGKSSMVEIVHFLLGGDCKIDSIFRCEELVEEQFGMAFDLSGNVVEIERSGSDPSQIVVNSADTNNWPYKPILDQNKGVEVISNTKWKDVLGSLIFNLPTDLPKFSPTFRSLISYFVRRYESGAFASPIYQNKKQQDWDYQVSLSYLIGLDWEIPQEIENIRQKEISLKILKKEFKKGFVGEVLGSAATLRTRIAVAERKLNRLSKEVSNFQVLPEYRELEKEASTIAVKQSKLANENLVDEEAIRELDSILESEAIPSLSDLSKIYNEAGIVFPENINKRFEDVEKFHNAILKNRKSHLQGEIQSAQNRISQRNRNFQNIDQRKREIMGILNVHGALDQYNKLQQELNRVQNEVEQLKEQYAIADRVETTSTDLTIERMQLQKRLTDDYREQNEILEEAILKFEDLSKSLSEKEGSLTIEPTDRGPQFDVRVESKRSRGISNMQIFCFDLMLTIICQLRGVGPGFLIHDSHLFDGMDSRQIAKAIQIGSEASYEYDFQYIITMNSDMIPFDEFSKDFDIHHCIMSVQLTDASEDGGLFGFRFE